MRNIKLTIRYDGSRYAGWQFQKNSLAIQQVIQDAIRKITGERVNLTGSGRTDAGVHAEAQIANFKTHSKIPLKNLQMALNSKLPKDIAITHAEEAHPKFNAQHSAKAKLYRYTVFNNDYLDPLHRQYAAKCFFRLDLAEMRRAARLLVGRHDFKSFQTVDGKDKGSIRKIYYIKIAKSGNVVYIYVKADGFLYNMARAIVGTLVEAGRGKFSIQKIKEILAKKDRRFCGPTMPAKGLCLVKVFY